MDTLLKNGRGTRIDISGYTLSSRYTTPTDGYLYVVNSSGASGKGYVYDSSNNNFGAIGGNVGEYMTFIRKGMQLGAYQSPSQIYFVPFA